MFRFVILVTLAACAHGAVFPHFERIVGGSDVSITEVPYNVALLIDINGNGIYSQACGGVIISRSIVLTSAQCTNGFTVSRLRIRAGSTQHNSGGQVILVKGYKINEGFNAQNLQNDISILYLSSDITLGSTAATITLPAQAASIQDGTPCVITGWGRISAGGSSPINLRKATVPIVNQNLCVSSYAGYNTVTTNMLCAGRLGTGGVDACQGDTGGPLVNNGILYGLSSWGKGCGEPQFPGVYTRVSMYRNWIISNM